MGSAYIKGELMAGKNIEFYQIDNPQGETIQNVIDRLSADAAWDNIKQIILPAKDINLSNQGITTLDLRPWVFMKGAGGFTQGTCFSSGAIRIGVGCAAGTTSSYPYLGGSRVRVDHLRFEGTPVTIDLTASAVTVGAACTALFNDVDFKDTGYIRAWGGNPFYPSADAQSDSTHLGYTERHHLSVVLQNCIHRNNSQAQSVFGRCRLMVYGGEFHMLNAVDAEVEMHGVKLKSDQMSDYNGTNWKSIANYGSTFNYNNCGEIRYTPETGVSLYHHLGAGIPSGAPLPTGATFQVQINGMIKGTGAPAADVGLEGSCWYELGTMYWDATNKKLYMKAAAAGTDTWTLVPSL